MPLRCSNEIDAGALAYALALEAVLGPGAIQNAHQAPRLSRRAGIHLGFALR